MNSTLDKALAELQSSPDTAKGKMDAFKIRLELTYTMLVEHYDDRLGDDHSDKLESRWDSGRTYQGPAYR